MTFVASKRSSSELRPGDIFIGCTICVKKSKPKRVFSFKKRKHEENESEDDCENEMNDKIAKLLDEKISNLKAFLKLF